MCVTDNNFNTSTLSIVDIDVAIFYFTQKTMAVLKLIHVFLLLIT